MDLASIDSFYSIALGLLAVFGIRYLLVRMTNPLYKIPGPRSFPVIGSMLSLNAKRPHLSLCDFAKRYGNVVKLQVFDKIYVAINGFDLCYEVLVKKTIECSGRPSTVRLRLALGEDVVFTSGAAQNRRKKLFMSAMKNYGTGLDDMNEFLSEATQRFLLYLESKKGQAVNIAEEFSLYVCNVISALKNGIDLPFDDPELQAMKEYTKLMADTVSPTKSGAELDSFPWLLKVPILNTIYHRRFQKLKQYSKPIVENVIEKEMHDYDQGSREKPGLLPKFVKELKSQKNAGGEPVFSKEDIIGMVKDLMGAGLETTRRTMTQIFLELCKQPELVRPLQSEIDAVVGKDRAPRIADRHSMPFTEAVIEEGHRILSVIPIAFRQTMTDVDIGGFTLPKDTPLMVNLWGVHHDENIYPDPFHYDPYRFLDSQGQLIPKENPKRKCLMPFGSGKRVCAGEVFAKTRLFLLLVSLYQRLDFTLCDSDINSDVRSYDNEVVVEAPEVVMVKFTHRD